jgi:hypothetical protein
MTLVRFAASKDLSASGKRVVPRFLLTPFLCLLAELYCCIEATASQGRKTYFFATREACIASGRFQNWECTAAFTIALDQLSNHAPSFSSLDECQFRFRLCSRRQSETETLYAPQALGIEIDATPNGSIVAPTLAIETPMGMLPPQPVSRTTESQEADRIGSRDVELAPRSDGFEPFRGGSVVVPRKFILQSDLVGISSTRSQSASTPETTQARRMRIKSAPLIE